LAGFWIRRARRPVARADRHGAGGGGGAGRCSRRRPRPACATTPFAAFFWVAKLGVRRTADRLLLAGGRHRRRCKHTWSLGVEEQYYLFWPLLVIAVVTVIAARARWAVFRASPPRAQSASAAAAIVLASDAGVKPGLLRHRHPGAGPAGGLGRGPALLVPDWSVLTAGGTSIRTRWRRWGRGWVVGPRPGDVGGSCALCDGQRPRVSAAGLLIVGGRWRRFSSSHRWLWTRVGPVAAARLAWRPLVWLGRDLLPASTCGTGRSSWRSTGNAPAGPVGGCSRCGVRRRSRWPQRRGGLLEQPIRRWRPGDRSDAAGSRGATARHPRRR